MASITIGSTTLPDWQRTEVTNVEFRVWVNDPFVDSDGVLHLGGDYNANIVHRASCTVDTSAKTITIPSIVIPSTTDGLNNQFRRYFAAFVHVRGNSVIELQKFTIVENGFRLGPTPTGTTWPEIIDFNVYFTPNYDNSAWPKDVSDRRYATAGSTTSSLTGDVSGVSLGGVVNTTLATSIAGPKTFTDLFTLNRAPAADPGQGNTTTVSMLKGADSSAASPSSSNNPSIYFQTIRTGGTHGTAMFGNLWNFQLTGVAAADTYADYLISRVSPDMTGAPTGEYYHLARRNYIIMRPTNFGSSSVVGYGVWNQGEVQVTGCAAYGAQIDCNNNSGSDMAHEDFSSKFKGACIATNFTSTNNVSAIIYSQGATNTAAYKGWKVAPNAVIRHLLDFSEAFYSLGGTVAVTNGSGAIVGTGTKFLTDLVLGDQLQFVGVPYTITAIADNTHATISPVYAGSTASGLATAKYVTPLRMAPMCYITAYNGALDFRFAGLDAASRWQIDPDGRSTIFGGIVQVPSPLQIGGNTSAEIALKRTGTQLQTRLGDDSAYASFAASFYVESEGNVALGNGDNNDIAIGNSGAVRFSGPSGAYAITGFQGGAAGRKLTIYNISAQACTIKSDAGSSTANRIYTLANGANSDVAIAAYGAAMFVYSSVDSRWILTGLVK